MNAALSIVLTLVTGLTLSGCLGGSDDEEDSDRLASQLHAAYDDQPFKGGQQTPEHEWSFVNSAHDQIVFLHWMPDDHEGHSIGGDAEMGDALFATGDGFKSRWCRGAEGLTDEEQAAGFVHFHKETAAEWSAGHGGTSATQVGYWLRHVAAQSGVEMMPGVVSKAGEVYPLMPSTTNLPACG